MKENRGNYIVGFTETLTIVFIVLKLMGIITWSWWLVLLPELIAGALYLIFVSLYVAFGIHVWRGIK
ncbi:hypothetical protein HOS79_gp037 [Lactobacillus phage Nyseid]|uniref:Uncharacterized protein n=1 Tax=Lactobacillus phage Nyseid TaxID=2079432 RepID=A0A2K9VC64_9CAUD|nr:hypothetical protein HOS79_gp037 [Lactobacillus phage Nyseid]AUV59797.1 hypothetical protein [Lactobacillus phage Nyseid]